MLFHAHYLFDQVTGSLDAMLYILIGRTFDVNASVAAYKTEMRAALVPSPEPPVMMTHPARTRPHRALFSPVAVPVLLSDLIGVFHFFGRPVCVGLCLMANVLIRLLG